jgi:hypothetical protein
MAAIAGEEGALVSCGSTIECHCPACIGTACEEQVHDPRERALLLAEVIHGAPIPQASQEVIRSILALAGDRLAVKQGLVVEAAMQRLSRAVQGNVVCDIDDEALLKAANAAHRVWAAPRAI